MISPSFPQQHQIQNRPVKLASNRYLVLSWCRRRQYESPWPRRMFFNYVHQYLLSLPFDCQSNREQTRIKRRSSDSLSPRLHLRILYHGYANVKFVTNSIASTRYVSCVSACGTDPSRNSSMVGSALVYCGQYRSVPPLGSRLLTKRTR